MNSAPASSRASTKILRERSHDIFLFHLTLQTRYPQLTHSLLYARFISSHSLSLVNNMAIGPSNLDPARHAHLNLNIGGHGTSTRRTGGQTPTPGPSQTSAPEPSGPPGTAPPPQPAPDTPRGTADPQQQADIMQQLMERVRQLEAEIAASREAPPTQDPPRSPRQPTSRQSSPPPVPEANTHQLFEDDSVISKLQEAFVAHRGDTVKKSQPAEIIPGFRASTLDIVVPPKIDEAFKALKYVPYSAIITAANRAWKDEEEFVVNRGGGLTSKGLDRRDERSLSFTDWSSAAQTAEARYRVHHSAQRAEALAKHHSVVTSLARTHSWTVALEYDISQRELSAQYPQHDLSTLNSECLTVVSTRLAVAHPQLRFPPQQSASSATKRPAGSTAQTSPSKRVARMCFRCGLAGHFPADCKADTTTAGKPVAALATNARSKHALAAADNKQYCFSWAQNSSCSFADKCYNHHGCSLCGSATHGAAGCNARG